jgi:magnesium transporter
MSVESVYYSGGVRQPVELRTLEDAAAIPRRGGNYVWVELDDPSPDELKDVAELFDLHELAVEDASAAHQRPKVEAYDGFHLIVFKTARYDAHSARVEFGEVDIFVGVGFVIAVRHGAAGDPIRTRYRVEQHPELLKTGPSAVVWGILDVVVDDYLPVVEALEREIDDVERAIFAGQGDLTERVYLLRSEIIELFRALHPLLAPLEAMEHGEFRVDAGLRRYFRDVADHVRLLQDEVIIHREQIAAALEANFALISLRQNEIAAQQNQVVKQLTLVATVFLPLAFITGFFGQNFAWLVKHITSFESFLVVGIASLVLSCIALLLWFREGGLTR